MATTVTGVSSSLNFTKQHFLTKVANVNNKSDLSEAYSVALASATSSRRQLKLVPISRDATADDAYNLGREKAFSLLGIEKRESSMANISCGADKPDSLLLASNISSSRRLQFTRDVATNNAYKLGREKAFALLGIGVEENSEKAANANNALHTDKSDAMFIASTISSRRQVELNQLSADRIPVTNDLYKKGREKAFSLLGIKTQRNTESTTVTPSGSLLDAVKSLSPSCYRAKAEGGFAGSITTDIEAAKLRLASTVAKRRRQNLPNLIATRSKNGAYECGREQSLALLGILSKSQDCKKTSRLTSSVATLTDTRKLPRTSPLSLASVVSCERYRDLKKRVPCRNDITDGAYKHCREEALELLKAISKQEHGEIPNKLDVSVEEHQVATVQGCYKSESLETQNVSSGGISDSECLLARDESEDVTETFPEKLHRMLTELEASGKENTTSFLPNGRAFVINCQVKFIHEAMPNYFRFGRFSSFEHQLYLHGFRKVSSGPDSGAYFHELFQKDHPKLLTHIKRIEKTSGMKKGCEKVERLSQCAAA